MKHWQNADQLWSYVVREEPRTIHYLDAYINLGTACIQDGKYEKAERALRTAISIDPKGPDAYYNLAYIPYYRGNVDSALQLFIKAITVDSTYAKAYFNIGSIEFQRGNDSLGLESLRRAARLGFADAQQALRRNGFNW
jgi:tetratricopeptide (TPR) repeat protein